MPNTTISIEFPEYKLKAIEQALRDKQEKKSVQDLLLEHTDGLYQKHVPAQARHYLDAMLGNAEQTQAVQEQENELAPRRSYRRRDTPTPEQANSPAPLPRQSMQEAPEPEQTQEMTMGM